MVERARARSFKTWLVSGKGAEISIREEIDRSGVVLELRPEQGAPVQAFLSPEAWACLCEVRYELEVELARREPIVPRPVTTTTSVAAPFNGNGL